MTVSLLPFKHPRFFIVAHHFVDVAHLRSGCIAYTFDTFAGPEDMLPGNENESHLEEEEEEEDSGSDTDQHTDTVIVCISVASNVTFTVAAGFIALL